MNTDEKRAVLTAAGKAVREAVPKSHGVIVIIAPIDTPICRGGEFTSDMRKGDCIKLLRDTADRLEENLNRSQ